MTSAHVRGTGAFGRSHPGSAARGRQRCQGHKSADDLGPHCSFGVPVPQPAGLSPLPTAQAKQGWTQAARKTGLRRGEWEDTACPALPPPRVRGMGCVHCTERARVTGDVPPTSGLGAGELDKPTPASPPPCPLLPVTGFHRPGMPDTRVHDRPPQRFA